MSNDTLHPELQHYVSSHPSLGKLLQHPLVYWIPYQESFNSMINELYQRKLTQCDDAIRENDWAKFVHLHEKPFRVPAFLKVIDNLNDKEYWELLSHIWTTSENVSQYYDVWCELWSANRPDRQFTMSDNELKALKRFPETVTIYRGYCHEDAVNGLSWTLRRSQALWFAQRFGGMAGREPRVAIAEANRDDILAYFSSEKEIVILPEHLRILRETEVNLIVPPL